MKYPETVRQEVEAMFSFLTEIMRINSNNTLEPRKINLIYEPPSEFTEMYIVYLGSVPSFKQERNELIFHRKDLKIPMKAFNPETFRLLKTYVEKKMQRLNNKESFTDKVRSILLASFKYCFPDIETVATKLNVSARTLQRYLSGENTSFLSILQEIRTELAKQMLQDESLSISEISYTLGYSDISNFSRSFKKITNVSPQQFRKFSSGEEIS